MLRTYEDGTGRKSCRLAGKGIRIAYRLLEYIGGEKMLRKTSADTVALEEIFRAARSHGDTVVIEEDVLLREAGYPVEEKLYRPSVEQRQQLLRDYVFVEYDLDL